VRDITVLLHIVEFKIESDGKSIKTRNLKAVPFVNHTNVI
jgi:hypothetical protein